MQRHIKRSAPVDIRPVLSREEMAILDDDLNEAELSADNEADQMERVTEIADVASDAMVVVNGLPEVGQVEQDLVAAVADMAVAGTDTDASEVLSVATDDGISTEGIASVLSKIWQAIVAAIKNMWVGLKHWLTTYFSALEQNKKHAEGLITKLDGMKGFVSNVNSNQVQITDIFNYNHKYGKQMSKIMGESMGPGMADAQVTQFIAKAAQAQLMMVSKLGNEIVDIYKKYDGTDINVISQDVDGLHHMLGDYIKQLGLSEHGAFNMAYLRVEAKGYSDKLGAQVNSVETKVAFLSKVRFQVSQSTDFLSDGKVFFVNDTTPDAVKDAVQKRLKYIDALLSVKQDHFKRMEDQVAKVEQACEQMLGKIKEENKEGTIQAKRLMQLSSAYANWGTQPLAKLLTVSARHNKFWLTLAEMVSNNFVAK